MMRMMRMMRRRRFVRALDEVSLPPRSVTTSERLEP